MNTRSFDIPDELAQKIFEYSAQREIPAEDLVLQAVREFIGREEEIIAEIKESLAAAERGEFATDEEVKAVFRKYNPHPRFL